MTTYPTQYLSDISNGLSEGTIPEEKLVYFRARLKNRIHAMVMDYFVRIVKDKGFTKADLARKLNKRPEQITRWLGGPSNLTLDTVSDLLLAMGHEPLIGAADLALGAVRPSSELWKIAEVTSSAQQNTETLPERPAIDAGKVADLASYRDASKGRLRDLAESTHQSYFTSDDRARVMA